LEKGEDLTFNEIEQLLEHVTIADVAKALGVSRSWLIGYLKRHRSPAEVKKYSPPKKLKKRKKRKYDLDALLKQAHENGVMISSGGLYQRLHKGMSKQE